MKDGHFLVRLVINIQVEIKSLALLLENMKKLNPFLHYVGLIATEPESRMKSIGLEGLFGTRQRR